MSTITFLSSLGILGKGAFLKHRADVLRRSIAHRNIPARPAENGIHICMASFGRSPALCGASHMLDSMDAQFHTDKPTPTYRIDTFYRQLDPSRIREWACPDCLAVLDQVGDFDPRPIHIRSLV